jgi:hypothetical protein
MRIVYRAHAIQRMFQRSITEEDVRNIVKNGIIIEDYPEDLPYPSRLLLGWIEDRPLHLVAAYNAQSDEEIVITVYEPDTSQWTADFMRRRK